MFYIEYYIKNQGLFFAGGTFFSPKGYGEKVFSLSWVTLVLGRLFIEGISSNHNDRGGWMIYFKKGFNIINRIAVYPPLENCTARQLALDSKPIFGRKTIKSMQTIRIVLAILIAFVFVAQADEDARLMRERIDTYCGSNTNSRQTLRVVYFHPSDQQPYAGFQDRIQRIMEDIQNFYRSEMKRNGFGEIVFSLEKSQGKLKIHVVKGKDPSIRYDYKSGGKVKRELKDALRGTIDLDREFVIVFYGLFDPRDDGSYNAHSPYYGDGGSCHRYGLCHVADCELLDTKWFTTTDRQIKYTEHTGTFKQSLGEFNTKYIGGIAHELGHGLGLPHNGQTQSEAYHRGQALMGSGNHTYRDNLRGGRGTFLTKASATRLASHPLLTKSNPGADASVSCNWSDLGFAEKGADLIIEGTIDARPEAYAVIAYVDPEGKSDYDALTAVATVRDGTFRI